MTPNLGFHLCFICCLKPNCGMNEFLALSRTSLENPPSHPETEGWSKVLLSNDPPAVLSCS